MALSQKLEIRQSQALVMTPQLMQAIKLLQLSSLDLVTYVEGELERNPLLDRSSDNEPEPGDSAGPDNAAGPPADASASDWMGQELETSRTAIEERLDTEVGQNFATKFPQVIYYFWLPWIWDNFYCQMIFICLNR